MVCYDDRFIVKLAYESDGVVVSNDTYRDLQGERQEWKRFIEERLLMYSFVNDKYVTAGDWLCWAAALGVTCVAERRLGTVELFDRGLGT